MKHLLILLLSVSSLISCKSKTEWSSKDITDFTSSCEREAIRAGLENVKAVSYCNCMQVKMQKQYPNVKDAAKVSKEDLEKPAMQAQIKECLGD